VKDVKLYQPTALVKAVFVTEDNREEVRKWCDGLDWHKFPKYPSIVSGIEIINYENDEPKKLYVNHYEWLVLERSDIHGNFYAVYSDKIFREKYHLFSPLGDE